MDDKEFRFHVAKIISASREFEAIQILLDFVNKTQKELYEDFASSQAALRAIKKINRGKNKDIDALCDDA